MGLNDTHCVYITLHYLLVQPGDYVSAGTMTLFIPTHTHTHSQWDIETHTLMIKNVKTHFGPSTPSILYVMSMLRICVCVCVTPRFELCKLFIAWR